MTNKNDNKHSRGSVWRKWDLHVHTPLTKLNNQYKAEDENKNWDTFCEKIENSDVSVFGITDYFSIDNYFYFVKIFKEKYSDSKKVFFPNIEFRIDSKNSKNAHIQIHVIFSNKIEVLNKLSNFFTRLKLVTTDNESLTNKYCTNQDLIEVSYEKAMVKIDDLLEQLKSNFSNNDYLIIGVATGYGSLTPADKNDGRGSEYAKEIDKICNIFFGNKGSVDFFLNKKEGRSQYGLSKKPVISGSDSHSFQDLEKKLGKKYIKKDANEQICDNTEITWIKSDPSFEGLMQITYEPEERVKIQEINPEYEFDKPYFEKITIKNEIDVYENQNLKIEKSDIILNKNLVAIIGGRGEGKSTIINYFGCSLDKIDNNNNEYKLTNSGDFHIEHHKINSIDIQEFDKKIFKSSEKSNNQLNYVFIKQGELKDKTNGNLSNILKTILNLEEASFSKAIAIEISNINNEIYKIEQWKLYKNEQGELVNTKTFQENIIKINNILLENLKNSKNKRDIEKYNYNLSEISKLKKIISVCESVLVKTNNFISDIDNLIKNDETLKSPNLDDYKKEIEALKNSFSSKITNEDLENESIKKSLQENGLSGDLTSLLENTTKYQNIINQVEINIVEINEKESELKILKKARSDLGEIIKQDYERQKKEIDEGWNNFLSNHPKDKEKIIRDVLLSDDKIVVGGEIKFNKDTFYNLLADSLHKNTFKDNEELESTFKITNLENWADFVKNNFNEKYDSLNHKKPEFLDLFFSTEKRSKYLKTEAEIKYDGKYLNQLSAGQKGTAYLRIQLANSAFSEPIIFDQPEDDLDNKFIVSELVDIFKELKKYRQIIIVTHNANLVVNADAEQVIIAKNNDEKLSYISGSLEDKEIQKHVCDILEGGQQAFEQRKKKYNLK